MQKRTGRRSNLQPMTSRNARRVRLLVLALAPISAMWANPSLGQTLTWDASGANPAAPTDGSGDWLSNNWSNGASDSAWVNGNIAAIGNGGPAGVITINGAGVSAAGINFGAVSGGAYTISATGANTLTLLGPASINFAGGVSAAISAPIAGSAGLNVNGTGTLTLLGANSFTGPVAINSGAVIVGTGGNLGASTNGVSLGTPNNGTSSGDLTGSLEIAPGVTTTVNSFVSATNNSTGTNTVSIGGGATMNVTGNSPLSGLNAAVNSAFVVGSSNAASAIVTNLTVSGAGTMNVSGGTNNSSFVVGLGNGTLASSNTFTMAPFLDMSGLANFSFITGTGAQPATGGNGFLVGFGSSAGAKMNLAVNSFVRAGTIVVGDNSAPTPGLTGQSGNNASNANTLSLGTGSTILNADNIVIGNGRAIGNLNFLDASNGSVTIAGAAGGASTANIIIGIASGGTPASTSSKLELAGHTAVIQAGTVTVGFLNGGSGGTSNTKGGSISFDAGTFNVSSLKLAVAAGGTSGGSIAGTFNLGSSPSSTGVLNVSSLFTIASYSGGNAAVKGTFNIKGGTANINTNIIDNSTGGTSNTAIALTGGTLNMMGFAIGTTAPGTGGTKPITTITLPTNTATLANLGGDGINGAGLNMNGTGTLIIEGTNTYTGATTISAGTLQIGQTGDTAPISLPAGAVADNSNLSFGSSIAQTFNNVVNGPGTVNQVGSGTTTLTAVNNYGGATNVTNGTLRIATSGTIGAAALNVSGTSRVEVVAGRGNNAIRVAGLTVGTLSTVDMNDNDMVVANGSYADTTGLIRNARNNGAWDQPGLTSSTAKAAVPKNKTLGTLTGAEFIAVNGPTFDGVGVAGTDVLVKYTYYGDVDFNGLVDFDDYSRIDAGFNNNRTGWLNGDVDYNGIVDFDDYSLIDQAFNTQSGTLRRAMSYLDGGDRSNAGMGSPSLQLVMEHFGQFGEQYAAGFLASVPEPTFASVAGLFAGALLRRRRRV